MIRSTISPSRMKMSLYRNRVPWRDLPRGSGNREGKAFGPVHASPGEARAAAGDVGHQLAHGDQLRPPPRNSGR